MFPVFSIQSSSFKCLTPSKYGASIWNCPSIPNINISTRKTLDFHYRITNFENLLDDKRIMHYAPTLRDCRNPSVLAICQMPSKFINLVYPRVLSTKKHAFPLRQNYIKFALKKYIQNFIFTPTPKHAYTCFVHNIALYRNNQHYKTYTLYQRSWDGGAHQIGYSRCGNLVTTKLWTSEHRALDVETFFRSDFMIRTRWQFRLHLNVPPR